MIRSIVFGMSLVFAGCATGTPDCAEVTGLEARVGEGIEPELSWDMGPVARLTVTEVERDQSVWQVEANAVDGETNLIASPVTYGDTDPSFEILQLPIPLEEGVDYHFFASVRCLTNLGPSTFRSARAEFTP